VRPDSLQVHVEVLYAVCFILEFTKWRIKSGASFRSFFILHLLQTCKNRLCEYNESK